MAGTFTVGALALAAEGANAVGAVRLTLLPDVLEIELVRAAGFRSGFVPGSVAESVDMRVPYTAVRGLVRRGRALCLALDPSIAAPYTRFTLARFTYDPREALARAYEARRRAALSVALLPAPLGLIAALASPASLVTGLLGRLAVGLVVAAGSFFLLRELLRFATWGGPGSDRLAETFELALCQRLGFVPVATAPFAPPPAPPIPEASLPAWARAPLLVALVAALSVLGISFFQRYGKPPDPATVAPNVPLLVAHLASAFPAPSPAEASAGEPRLPRCVCAHAASPLWNDGLPVLEVLLASRPEDGSGRVVPSERRGYNFDLSVVNNGSTRLPDVSVLVTFARRDDQNRRVGATDRGLYWGKPLYPGRAIKWHLKAPGTEMRIDPPRLGLLEAGREPASPDAFFELSHARQRVVRIHAAKMLAYHRDPRALEVLASLGPPSPDEETVLARITRAARPVIACDITPASESLEVCLFNDSLSPQRVVAARTIADRDAPSQRAPLPVVVPVHDGVRVSVPLPPRPVPSELDLEVDARGSGSPDGALRPEPQLEASP
ncbi:hypothetical protein [Polyangium jinanense]|uniref:Uncharacterized protein n=1 Tax=Polyangium jinanense TaxID=2829994 RepID=A0A9X4AWS0_9BACT|nr:hypothetical protein [Polyangium jinanense]MDC3956637.1 hypothetical protein [Polyangium jinanense]MDC3985580.1 hypothetical protein [Polyangium jinanense]